MKRLLFLLLGLMLSVSAFSVNPPIVQSPAQSLTLAEWAEMSPKEYMEATGEKLKFTDKIAHRYFTKKARKAIKKGELSGAETAPQSSQNGFGLGFILGFFLGLIGVIIAIIIKSTDDSGTKDKIVAGSAWGLLAAVVFVLLLTAVILV